MFFLNNISKLFTNKSYARLFLLEYTCDLGSFGGHCTEIRTSQDQPNQSEDILKSTMFYLISSLFNKNSILHHPISLQNI